MKYILILLFLLISNYLADDIDYNNNQESIKNTNRGIITNKGKRIVALGDLHGDLEGALRVLRRQNIIDHDGNWISGSDTLIQTGDLFDRGDDTCGILELFMRLQIEAEQHGGQVVNCLGNHEIMQNENQFVRQYWNKYITKKEVQLFGGPEMRKLSLEPSGKYGKWLRENPAVVYETTTQSVFLHGGIISDFAKIGISEINNIVESVLVVKNSKERYDLISNDIIFGDKGPFWNRDLLTNKLKNCEMLDKSLNILNAKRMIVGHTIQDNFCPNKYCDDRLIAIDVMISKAFGSGRHNGSIQIFPNGDVEIVCGKQITDLTLSQFALTRDISQCAGYTGKTHSINHQQQVLQN